MSLTKGLTHISFESDKPVDPEQYDFVHFVLGSVLATKDGVFAEAVVTLKCLDGSQVQLRYPYPDGEQA